MKELSNRRIFIFDVTAVVPYGHNYDSLLRVQKHFKNNHEKVYIFVPVNLHKRENQEEEDIFRNLPNMYFELHEIKPWTTRFNLIKKYVRFSYRIFWYFKNSIKIILLLKKFDKKFKLDEQDKVIFMNSDLLFTSLFLSLFLKRKMSIHIRFINVFEHFYLPRIWSIKKLATKIKKSCLTYVQISAETSNYAEYLSQYFEDVMVLPYPLKINSTKRINPGRTKNRIGILGSARPDKGFEQLPNLINQIDPDRELKFFVQQSASPWGASYSNTLSLLKSFENVELLEGNLSRKNLDFYIKNIDVMLLPYWGHIYITRGSAMFFESVENLIPVVAPIDTAFGRDIREFKLGSTYFDATDIKYALSRALKLNGKKVFAQSCSNYEFNALMNWDKLFKK